MNGFEFMYRDFGHWDIIVKDKRVFKIRGFCGCVSVTNEMTGSRIIFRTVSGAVSFIGEELTFEREIKEGEGR